MPSRPARASQSENAGGGWKTTVSDSCYETGYSGRTVQSETCRRQRNEVKVRTCWLIKAEQKVERSRFCQHESLLQVQLTALKHDDPSPTVNHTDVLFYATQHD